MSTPGLTRPNTARQPRARWEPGARRRIGRTDSAERRQGGRRPTRSRTPGCASSTAWVTTCRSRSGPSSSRRSPRQPSGGARSPPAPERPEAGSSASAAERSRTSTSRGTRAPEARASTSSATAAGLPNLAGRAVHGSSEGFGCPWATESISWCGSAQIRPLSISLSCLGAAPAAFQGQT